MSEESKESTLEPITEKPVIQLIKSLIEAHHPSLESAAIEAFWIKGKALTFWGSIGTAEEVLWWLSNADVLLRFNQGLWAKLSADGRKGLVDHFLSQVAAKTGGVTSMQTSRGERQLYEVFRPSLAVHPQVVARNPGLVDEISELRELQAAMSDPDQFLLDFAKRQDGEAAEAA